MTDPYAYKRAYKEIAEHYLAVKNIQGYEIYNKAYNELSSRLK